MNSFDTYYFCIWITTKQVLAITSYQERNLVLKIVHNEILFDVFIFEIGLFSSVKMGATTSLFVEGKVCEH